MNVCDFCSAPDVRWWFPARDIIGHQLDAGQAKVVIRSVGRWGACAPCHDLIGVGDWPGLAARANENGPQDAAVSLEARIALIRGMHGAFRCARTGPAVAAVREWLN